MSHTVNASDIRVAVNEKDGCLAVYCSKCHAQRDLPTNNPTIKELQRFMTDHKKELKK